MKWRGQFVTMLFLGLSAPLAVSCKAEFWAGMFGSSSDDDSQHLSAATATPVAPLSGVVSPIDFLECTPVDKNRGDGFGEFECRFVDNEGKPTRSDPSIKKVVCGYLDGRSEPVGFEVSDGKVLGPIVTVKIPVLDVDLFSKVVVMVSGATSGTEGGKDSAEFVITDSSRALLRSNDALSLGIDMEGCGSKNVQALISLGGIGSKRCREGGIVVAYTEDTGGGQAPAMACCQLETTEVLRSGSVQSRPDRCAENEIAVGFSNISANVLFCAQLAPSKAKLGSPLQPIFVPGDPLKADGIKFGERADTLSPMVAKPSELVRSFVDVIDGFADRDVLACPPNSVMVARTKLPMTSGSLSLALPVPECRPIVPAK